MAGGLPLTSKGSYIASTITIISSGWNHINQRINITAEYSNSAALGVGIICFQFQFHYLLATFSFLTTRFVLFVLPKLRGCAHILPELEARQQKPDPRINPSISRPLLTAGFLKTSFVNIPDFEGDRFGFLCCDLVVHEQAQEASSSQDETTRLNRELAVLQEQLRATQVPVREPTHSPVCTKRNKAGVVTVIMSDQHSSLTQTPTTNFVEIGWLRWLAYKTAQCK